jgi:hypothetical protein
MELVVDISLFLTSVISSTTEWFGSPVNVDQMKSYLAQQFVKNPINNTDMDSSTVDEMVMSDEPLKSKRIRKPVNKLDF